MSAINELNMLRVGTILHGTYKIESYLASGGFGNTYLAKNIEFDETYAIKEFFVKGVCQRDGNSTTISVSNAENTNSFEQQREKFKKEARRLRSLSNPHIVKVYDLFEENGTAYYVMDYVDGENLSVRLKRTNAPLAESEVRNYLNQILDGLEAIHNEGMFHLDIKPANIMVDSHDVVKLIDFGASKQQSMVGGATISTGISYTNGYAPSEQMAQSYDKFGPWTDFYALGATMYKLLTNQDPPSVSDLSEDETEDKHLALPMPNVSEEMKTLVVWMMQVNRLKRPKNVGEIRRILQQPSVATSNNEGTKAFSPYQSYVNPVNDDEETVWAGKIETAETNGDKLEPEEEYLDDDSSSKNRNIIIILVIAVVCAIAIMTRGCGGNRTASDINSVEASADSDSVVYEPGVDTIIAETGSQNYLNSIDYSSSKVTDIGNFNDETWKLVESESSVSLVSEKYNYSISNISWQDGEEHQLSSVLAVKLYKGKIWFIAYDDSHSIGATGVLSGTQIFNYDIKQDAFNFVMNCNSAKFKGKTIEYCEAQVKQYGSSAADNEYSYEWYYFDL
ncbi:serine/threonine protein kinase [Prevotella sp. SGI.167]|uniref:serine/threonine protein kinase n=1 Tax=Prevotella sp. SGI.167 TaxID=3420566 RepID=UPI004040BF8C